jgi:hypothetical protein
VNSFLETVLPTAGTYCAVGIASGRTRQRFFASLTELQDAADTLDAAGIDAYFALASFATNSRKADAALFMRAFFIDLDCGAGKPYADASEAAQALAKFVDDIALPSPLIVHSGGGLHAYWPFTQDVEIRQWLPAARAFKALCVAQKLAIDLSVTADVARILRVPGTHNYKTGVGRPVHIMVAGQPTDFAKLCTFLPAPPADLSAARAFGKDELTTSLAVGDRPPCSFDRIVRRSLKGTGCGQIAHAVKGAAGLEEPLWRAALSIAWNCQDAEKAIYQLSSDHPDYTPENTLEKAQRTTDKPYTCDWYRQNNPEHCQGCTHKITSPIVLGKQIPEAVVEGDSYVVEAALNPDNEDTQTTVEVEIPAYPFPYFRGVNGGVFRKDRTEDGETVEVEIYPHDLYVTARFYDSDDHGDGEGELVGVNLHLPHDGIRRFHAPVTALMTKDRMRDILVKHGAIIYGKQVDTLMAYIASSIRKLQTRTASSRTRSQMGWTPEGSFVVGELEYTAGGTKLAPPASGTRQLAPLFHARGTLEDWTSIIDFYDRPGMEGHAFGFFVGCASPLLQLLNSTQVRGAVVNLVSNESGTGKTTVQMAINSLFGHPSELLMGQKDTTAAKFQRLGALNSICMTIDEMTNESPEGLSTIVYGATTGRGAHRMEAQSNKLRANNTSWCSITVSSSNAVMAEALASHKLAVDGELKRVIDLHISVPEGIPKVESDAVFAQLEHNYGLAGPVFIQYVVAHRESVVAAIQKMQLKIDDEMKLERGDRFYSAVLAVAFTFAMISKKLGLHNIDVGRVYKYALREVGSVKESNKSMAGNPMTLAQETLSKFISENMRNALIINGDRNGEMAAPIMTPMGPLRMRYEPDTDELVIVAQDLRKFFVERRVDFKSSIGTLRRVGALKVTPKTGELTAVRRPAAGALGTLKGPPVRCYVFDGAKLGMKDAVANAETTEADPSTPAAA